MTLDVQTSGVVSGLVSRYPEELLEVSHLHPGSESGELASERLAAPTVARYTDLR
jgi:hypothetical protein